MPNVPIISTEQPSIAINQAIIAFGIFPSRDSSSAVGQTMGYMFQTAAVFVPSGTIALDGSLQQISSNDALFSLIGTTYGGDGDTTFAVPDTQGDLTAGSGMGSGLTDRFLGQQFGADFVALNTANLPAAFGGTSIAVSNVETTLTINYAINITGIFPSPDSGGAINMIGAVYPVLTDYAPPGTALCQGQLLPINQNQALFSIIGTTYGGDGRVTFALPDLRGRVPVGVGDGVLLGERIGSEVNFLTNANMPVEFGGIGNAFNNFEPGLGLKVLVAIQGVFPSHEGGSPDPASPSLGQIIYFAGNFVPKGFAEASGQLLPINQNQALFSLIGTTYGGDGRVNFALPDFRGRSAMNADATHPLGSTQGTSLSTLAYDDIPGTVQHGDAGDNSLLGGKYDDSLFGEQGNDTADGGDGNDMIAGGPGNDTIYGQAGEDILTGDGGKDTIYGGLGNDNVDGGAADDRVFGDAGDDFVTGGGLNDSVYGGDGNDRVHGGAGADLVNGEAGDDLIVGGPGIDLLVGGPGADRFLFNEGHLGSTLTKTDRIKDFRHDQGDVIDFHLLDADTSAGGDQAFAFIGGATFSGTAGELRFEVVGNTTYVFGDTDGDGVANFALWLTGQFTLEAGDFVL